jgi:hypothetical protein
VGRIANPSYCLRRNDFASTHQSKIDGILAPNEIPAPFC